MASIAELIGKETANELRDKFFPIKPGFFAEKWHVKFLITEDGVNVTLPTGKAVSAKISPKGNMFFLEFLEDIPEGYRRRAIDAWDKVLVKHGVRKRRKMWKDRHRKKKKGQRKSAPHEAKTPT